jgi:serine/threonine protein kinase
VTDPATIGRYEVRRVIGHGGFAVVYLAHDPLLGREVAVKLLRGHLVADAGARARFEREARIVAGLEHPAIIPIHDFGSEDGVPFLVTSYLPGGSLTDRLPITDALTVLRRIAEALDYAHALGVVHRDVKPANILFDRNGNACLGDFGIASVAAASVQITTEGQSIGTPSYMSPEQINGTVAPSAASDIYSLGCVAFELLCGRPPFVAGDRWAVMRMHLDTPPPSARGFAPHLGRGVDGVFQRCLAKAPGARYPSALAFVRDLEDADGQGATLQDAALQSPSSPPPRRRLPLLLGIGAAAMLAAGGIGYAAFAAFGGGDDTEPASTPGARTSTETATPSATPTTRPPTRTATPTATATATSTPIVRDVSGTMHFSLLVKSGACNIADQYTAEVRLQREGSTLTMTELDGAGEQTTGTIQSGGNFTLSSGTVSHYEGVAAATQLSGSYTYNDQGCEAEYAFDANLSGPLD